MRIEFTHKFGLQEQADVQYYKANLVDVQPHEYDDALAQGWSLSFENGQLTWFQSRSTRCDLGEIDYDLFNDSHYALGDHTKKKAELRHIYSAYCYYKKYQDLFHDEVETWLDMDVLFEYYDDAEFVGWSKLRRYSTKSLETVLFAWDYAKPDLKLGHNSLYHELAWAKQSGHEYVYMGPGYELSGLYKANIQGFQWWTGSEWSVDNQEYKRACRRDAKLGCFSGLGDL